MAALPGAIKKTKARPRHVHEITREMRKQAHGKHRTVKSCLVLPNGGCTLLPALQNVEGLLLQIDYTQDPECADTVNKVPELTADRSPRSGDASPGRFCVKNVTRNTSEFNECLRLPPLVKRQAFQRRETSTLSAFGTSSSSAGCPLRCVMLPETFGTGSNITVAQVADVLATVIELPFEKALTCAERCHGGETVMLESGSEKEARQTARHLRDKGLIARVTRKKSAEACSGSGGERLDEFAKMCYGTLRMDTERLAMNFHKQQETTERMWQGADHSWKQDADLKFELLPEDPVDAFFKSESQPPSPSSGRKRGMQALVRKHTVTLLKLKLDVPAEAADEPKMPSPQEIRLRRPITESWKEGCRLMRTFVFGAIGNEHIEDEQERDAIYYEPIGSKNLVSDLYKVWAKLDSDQSGRVDIAEFRTFAEEHMRGRALPGLNFSLGNDNSARQNSVMSVFIQKLCERLEKLLLSKKSSFAIQDVLRLCWPSAAAPEMRTMALWCREESMLKDKSRIKPPPVMAKADYEGLTSVYHLYNGDSKGLLHIDELLNNGIFQQEEKREWCKTHSSELTVEDFCEILCPTGFRATAQSTVGSLPDGRRVLVDAHLASDVHWRLATDEIMDSEESA